MRDNNFGESRSHLFSIELVDYRFKLSSYHFKVEENIPEKNPVFQTSFMKNEFLSRNISSCLDTFLFNKHTFVIEMLSWKCNSLR